MIDLLQLAELSLGGFISLYALNQRAAVARLRALTAKPPRRPVEDGSMAWSWQQGASKGWGPRCPKCDTITRMRGPKNEIVGILKFCECPEYHTPHYHFTCIRCSYKAIMRTADDPRDNL